MTDEEKVIQVKWLGDWSKVTHMIAELRLESRSLTLMALPFLLEHHAFLMES